MLNGLKCRNEQEHGFQDNGKELQDIGSIKTQKRKKHPNIFNKHPVELEQLPRLHKFYPKMVEIQRSRE